MMEALSTLHVVWSALERSLLNWLSLPKVLTFESILDTVITTILILRMLTLKNFGPKEGC
jgi:hypothetical protein